MFVSNYRLSCNGHDQCHRLKVIPDNPTAIVFFVHGMNEYGERYLAFAKKCIEKNYAFCSIDHIGHGKTAQSFKNLGHLEAGDGLALLGDVLTFATELKKEFPNLPLILIGHSMGSFIVRLALLEGAPAEGAIITGSGAFPKPFVRAIEAYCHTLDLFFPRTFHPIPKSKDRTGKSIEYAWLSRNLFNRAMVAQDPLMNSFSLGGFFALIELLKMLNQKEAQIPYPKIPFLMMRGTQDVVGAFGLSTLKLERLFAPTSPFEVAVYPGDRHELWFEEDYQDVQKRIFSFIQRNITKEALS